MHYNIGSSLYFASLLYALFKIGLTFFQISLTGIESKYMFKYNDNMKLYCGSFLPTISFSFLTTCAFQLYRLMLWLHYLASWRTWASEQRTVTEQLGPIWWPWNEIGGFQSQTHSCSSSCQNILYAFEPLSFSNVSAGVIFKGVSLQDPEQIR